MTYLVIFYCATAGQNGPLLGSDEEEIVLLFYLVLDTVNNKVVFVHKRVVKPRTADINENVLSEQTQTELGLHEDQVKCGDALEVVVEQFDQLSKSKLAPERPVYPLCDGQLHLRQCLHPEACSKDIPLPSYYHNFFDIRKEFRRCYSSAKSSVDDL
jgi:epithelial splicing regulatory protein 1/2